MTRKRGGARSPLAPSPERVGAGAVNWPMATRERWWIEGGEDECPQCGAPYAYEAEVRCIDCDSPMCPVCVVWMRREARCPGCVPAEK